MTQEGGIIDVRVCDLSLAGAGIEHEDRLQAGTPCTLEMPPALGSLTLSAHVVWSRGLGAERGPAGEPHARYRSGLTFASLTVEQQATLTRVLKLVFRAGGESR